MADDFVSASECARRHGVTSQAIDAAIKKGRIEAVKVGNVWVIRGEECARYVKATPQERGKLGGRPRKAKEASGDGE